MARSSSRKLLASTPNASMPTAGATVWIAAIWFWSGLESGSCRIAMRMTFGAIRLSISGHCVLAPNSDWQTPVTPEPGRSSAGTSPAPTGSTTLTNTTGMPLPAASSAFAVSRSLAEQDLGRKLDQTRPRIAGCGGLRRRTSAPRSADCGAHSSPWPSAPRSAHRDSRWPPGRAGSAFISTPMRRTRSGGNGTSGSGAGGGAACGAGAVRGLLGGESCALALKIPASGTAAAPPRSDMNSRRRI